MSETNLSSMTPEEGRLLSIRNARVERIFCEESALVPIRQYTRAMKEFSEAEHAAFLRGFEAAREAAAEAVEVHYEAARQYEASSTNPAERWIWSSRCDILGNVIRHEIRALTPAD